jgi:AraC-like DNA-binding protein
VNCALGIVRAVKCHSVLVVRSSRALVLRLGGARTHHKQPKDGKIPHAVSYLQFPILTCAGGVDIVNQHLMLGDRDAVQIGTRFWFSREAEMCLHPFSYRPGDMDSLPHTHDEYNIVFCLTPGLSYSLRGRVEMLTPGDVLVINPGDTHNGHYGDLGVGTRGLTLHISVRSLKEILTKMRIPGDLDHNRVLFLDKMCDRSLVALVEELMQEIDQRQNGYELVVDSIVMQILVRLFRGLLRPSFERNTMEPVRQLPSWQMVRTLEYMNARGKSKFSLAEICADIGTSTSRFIQLFKNSVNSVRPHVYYNRLIVDKAQRLLVAGDLSIKEIAHELGFQNESHFCKVFRSCAGTTPGTFRQQTRGMF